MASACTFGSFLEGSTIRPSHTLHVSTTDHTLKSRVTIELTVCFDQGWDLSLYRRLQGDLLLIYTDSMTESDTMC